VPLALQEQSVPQVIQVPQALLGPLEPQEPQVQIQRFLDRQVQQDLQVQQDQQVQLVQQVPLELLERKE
jgi:hypothetical protein